MTIIRTATISDVAAMAVLFTELGYSSAADAVGLRLHRLTSDPRALVIVAERDGRVVGVATAHSISVIHDDGDVAWLTSLVVDGSAQGRGIGRQLVEAVEAWARSHSCVRLSVTTARDRNDAHTFYERVGFEWTSRRYSKRLAVSRVKPSESPNDDDLLKS
jgi:GNAT superfamily N-acetyltransferase